MPAYLTCPFCPAQSYEKSEQDHFILFECPAHHKFYIERELNVRKQIIFCGNESLCQDDHGTEI